MRHANCPPRNPARRGFTLVEILIVLAIIAVLVSLGVAAIMRTRVVQETKNTNTNITKVDQAFQKRWLAVVETARNETPCALAQQWSGGDLARAKVIHIKLRLIQEFPVNFKEATNPAGGVGGLPPNPTYVRALSNATPGVRTWQDESSACLYLALKRQTRGVEFDPDTALSSQELVDPYGDGIKEIVDAWNQPGRPGPLVFTRFPGFVNPVDPRTNTTALLGLPEFRGGAQTYPASFDPVDQEGTLANATWVATSSAGFQQNVHPVAAGKTFTLFPVISSSGYDGITFVDKNGTTLNADDIYNFRLSTK